MTHGHRRPLAALLLALAVVATATLGSAATLTVNAASISTFTVTHPCPGTLTATTPATTGTVSTVEVTPPAACADRTLHVAVSDGTVVRQGTATAPASGSVTVSLDGAYTPSETGVGLAATADGWYLDTSWSYTPPIPVDPIVPGNPQTVITSITWTFPAQNQMCVAVEVGVNTTGFSDWQVDFAVDSPPFNGATSGYQVGGGNVQILPPGTAVDGLLHIGGMGGWQSLKGTQTRTFTICNYNLPLQPDNPSAYSVTYSQGIWTDTQACISATITGNGSSEFYFGWRARIDMAPAYQRIESTGREVRRVQQDTWGSIVAYSPAFSPTVSTYDLTSLWQGVLRLSETRTVGICAYEY